MYFISKITHLYIITNIYIALLYRLLCCLVMNGNSSEDAFRGCALVDVASPPLAKYPR